MRLAAREVARFCRSPDPKICGALLHGPDEGLVAVRRRELCVALAGSAADAQPSARLDAAAVRRNPSALDAALRARGFFGGRGVVVMESATDAVSQPIEAILGDAKPDDAFLIVCSGELKARSTLRRMFEGARHLVALQIVAEPPSRDDIGARLAALGHRGGLEPDAWTQLAAIASSLDAASLDRFLENLALYALTEDKPLTTQDITAMSPIGLEAETADFVDAVAGGHAEAVGPMLRRVAASGAAPVAILLGLQRHFRQMLTASASGERAPIWGARRDAVLAQSRNWRRDRLELAVRMLYETDARLRSAGRVPEMALLERCALRLAMMVER